MAVEDRWSTDALAVPSEFCEGCKEHSFTWQRDFNNPAQKALREIRALFEAGWPGAATFCYPRQMTPETGRFFKKPAVFENVEFQGYALGVITGRTHDNRDGLTERTQRAVVYSITDSSYVNARSLGERVDVEQDEVLVEAWRKLARRLGH